MRLADAPGWFYDTALRMLPHRAPTGLVRIGHPDRHAPVLLTGNFTLTVRRLRDALEGRDAWLLVADSRGINVWCAAGGGHLTHHDVISVIRTSGIADQVDHRELILPQLCATGVERRVVEEKTGWTAKWGPARLEDLEAYLGRGQTVRKSERHMRFPLWERLEMATMWAFPMLAVSVPVGALLGGITVALVTGLVGATTVATVFALLPRLPVRGGSRWWVLGGFGLAAFAVGAALLAWLGTGGTAVLGVGVTAWMGILAIDLEGTTPTYGSYINTFHNHAAVELVDDRCTGASDCVQVCPSDVLKMDGRNRKVRILHPDACIQCGACIVQCPEDALRFRYEDGTVVEADTIRATRMNLLGERRIRVDGTDDAPPR